MVEKKPRRFVKLMLFIVEAAAAESVRWHEKKKITEGKKALAADDNPRVN